MPGRHCAVSVCKNNYIKTKSAGKKIIFHLFPSGKDNTSQHIKKEWIRRCSRTDKWKPETSHICSDHFTENDYERDFRHELLNTPLRKRLKKTAVPSLSLGNIQTTEINDTENEHINRQTKNQEYMECVESNINSTTVSCSADLQPIIDESDKQWKQKYFELLKEFKDIQKDKENMIAELKLLKLELQSYKHEVQELYDREKRKINILNKSFTKNQLDILFKNRKRVTWTSEEIVSAHILKKLSKKAYLYVKDELCFPLPGLSSLRRFKFE